MNTHHGRARRLGLMLWPAPGLGAGFERGRWAASHGYDDLWLADAEGLEDPLTLAAALGVACDKVRLATGIVPVFNRPPALLATAVVAAEARAPGRLVLGLGASTPNMIERWYGLPYAKPLTRVRETIALLRQILNGEKTAFDGATLRSHGFQLKSLPTQPVPIVLGAIGGKMLELAGEVADGVLLNDFTPPDRLAYALERLDVGAKRGGRRVEDLEIIKRRALYLTDDAAGGMEYFRQHLAFYASAAQYQNVMIELGYGHAVEEARAGYATRDRRRITAAISDDIVERIFSFGNEARCRALVAADYAAGVDTVIISPQGGTMESFARGAEAFLPSVFDRHARA
ncbi:MAG: LLM class flavin-dependent oxidoreductase [Proteobacteria bacterium]|nr:LLM class flavin-dependent oxidoreductase [Pseudomonadota bacterium]